MILTITAPPVPEVGADFMPRDTASFSDALWELLGNVLGQLRPDLTEALQVCLGILAVVILVSVLKLFPGGSGKTADLVGAVGIGAMLLQSSNSLIHLAVDTITDVSQYGKLLLPVMASAMAAQGGMGTSTALYAGTALFDSMLCSLLIKLMVPGVYCFLSLSVANAALGEPALKKLAGLVKWLSVWVLKIILYVFTGYIGITGVISGTTDAAALKAAKLTISGTVPVVGGILADASEAVLVGAGVVKNAAGIYGILAVLSVCAGPFLRLGSHYVAIKVTVALCTVFGAKQCTDLVEDFSGAMGLLLAMAGSVCLLQLISTVCFLRGVG